MVESSSPPDSFVVVIVTPSGPSSPARLRPSHRLFVRSTSSGSAPPRPCSTQRLAPSGLHHKKLDRGIGAGVVSAHEGEHRPAREPLDDGDQVGLHHPLERRTHFVDGLLLA